jgi:DNA-binding LacI/PurR family transcriptional regulator
MRSSQITIKDIAKQLGISASTVSRALKDHPDISEKTKLKVKELAKELNYKPNVIALSLQRSKSDVIGIIVPQIVHHFFSTVISGIEEYCNKKGYNVLICQSNESVEREVANTQTLISGRVDGIIVSRTKFTENFEHFIGVQKSHIPMVFFDRTCHGLQTDKVIIDDYKAAFEATEYLIHSGCKELIHFAGPENLKISAKRMWGFIDALKKNNLQFDDKQVIKADSFTEGKYETEKIIQSGNLPDGIFTVNDMTAAGVIQTLKRHHIHIPEQISVFGFTNGLISTITHPPLSTVEQNGYLMGYKSAELLINRIENKEIPYVTEIIPTKLLIRESTKNIL